MTALIWVRKVDCSADAVNFAMPKSSSWSAPRGAYADPANDHHVFRLQVSMDGSDGQPPSNECTGQCSGTTAETPDDAVKAAGHAQLCSVLSLPTICAHRRRPRSHHAIAVPLRWLRSACTPSPYTVRPCANDYRSAAREKGTPQVDAYLRSERDYAEAYRADGGHWNSSEMVSRHGGDDTTPAYREGTHRITGPALKRWRLPDSVPSCYCRTG